MTPGFRISSKLERPGALGLRPDVHGAELVFLERNKEVGRARTGRDGLAYLEWRPGPGVHELTVELPADRLWRGARAPLRVFVRDATRPVLVVDLDGTICLGSSREVLSSPPEKVPAFPGAREARETPARSYDLLYLTARDDALMASSRAWLDHHRFPQGPPLVRDLTLFTLSAERHKREILLQLKKSFRLAAGVGDRDEDAAAYMAAGMVAILIGDGTTVPRGARKLVTWDEVAKLLALE
ncbi:MAG: LNS2 domain-containing protein [Planctomycetaceae bacterium]